MNKNLLTQLREKGLALELIHVNPACKKLKATPSHLIVGEARYWLQTRKQEIISLLKKENKLRRLIEKVGYRDNWSLEEMEEMFQYALKNFSLEEAIDSYQTTLERQAHLIPAHYTKSVHCKGCGDVTLWESCPEKILGCPLCLDQLGEIAC
jgi:hypothetical protein